MSFHFYYLFQQFMGPRYPGPRGPGGVRMPNMGSEFNGVREMSYILYIVYASYSLT